MQCCAVAQAGFQPAVAGGVYEAGLVPVRWARSPNIEEIVGDYRLAGDLQPPPFPFGWGLRWLIGGQQMISAQWASCVLPGEQAQRVAIEWWFDPRRRLAQY